MSKLGLVRLELAVEEMRHHVVHGLVERQGEIQRLVDAEVEGFIKSGALEQKIRESVHRYLDHAIDEGVQSAISKWTRESPTVKQAVQRAVHDALWNAEK